MKFDLHVHTNCSDGSDSPIELLEIAAKAGLSGISITDHDTVDAYQGQVFEKAKNLSIQLLTGIELSTEWNEQSIHLLGYRIDPDNGELKSFLKELIERRKERNLAILKRLSKKGFLISEEEINPPVGHPRKTIGRPHIAYVMLQKGYVQTMQEAFEKYLKEGASCFVPGIKYTPKEGIEIIRKAGGKAVLAHPHFIKKGRFLKYLLSLDFDGIECYYGLLYPDQEAPWIQIAKEKGWIATGGSDYHGAFKPHIPIGCSWVGEETFSSLSR